MSVANWSVMFCSTSEPSSSAFSKLESVSRIFWGNSEGGKLLETAEERGLAGAVVRSAEEEDAECTQVDRVQVGGFCSCLARGVRQCLYLLR